MRFQNINKTSPHPILKAQKFSTQEIHTAETDKIKVI